MEDIIGDSYFNSVGNREMNNIFGDRGLLPIFLLLPIDIVGGI